MFIRETAAEIILSVRAHAGAKRNRICGLHGDALKIEVTAAPERGKANAAIAELIAEVCSIPIGAIILKQGETSRAKIFALRGCDFASVKTRLESAVSTDKKGNR